MVMNINIFYVKLYGPSKKKSEKLKNVLKTRYGPSKKKVTN